MKILYGITKSNFGGAQRYVFDLAKGMRDRGHDVAVMCGGDGILVKKLKEENIRTISIPGFGRNIDLFGDVSRLLFIIKKIWKEKPNVLHINSAKMGGVGVFTGRLLGIKKIIFTGHGWAFNEVRPRWQKILVKFFTWWTILWSHKTICVSEKTKRDVNKWPFVKNKLKVIYNGIEPFPLSPRITTDFTVGAISELHKVKGLDILLNAWAKFVKNREAKLIIMGDGEERKNLEKLIKELEITQTVELQGQVDNARAELSNFDIFVMPSRSESLPYSLLEAGMSSRPVIASAVGGIPEIVESGVTGELIESENVEALLSSLILFYDNPMMLDRLGETLKESVEKKFSFEKMVKKTESIYL